MVENWVRFLNSDTQLVVVTFANVLHMFLVCTVCSAYFMLACPHLCSIKHTESVEALDETDLYD